MTIDSLIARERMVFASELAVHHMESPLMKAQTAGDRRLSLPNHHGVQHGRRRTQIANGITRANGVVPGGR